tara:strand:- start:1701 stop:2348 length:648 start_codon:yes stop_codon:yes gene_type:complete
MSYQHFHRWGDRNHDDIQKVIRGDNYITSGSTNEYVWVNSQLDGDTIFNKTFEGCLGFSSGEWDGTNLKKGTFLDATMYSAEIFPSGGSFYSGFFERYWLQYLNAPQTNQASPGVGNIDGRFGVGVAWNAPTLWPNDGDGDQMSVQHSGIAYVRSSSTTPGVQREFVSAAQTPGDEGQVEGTGSSGFTYDFGLVVNLSPYSGSISILLNFSEKDS